jgi:cholesterol oxidase
MARLKGAWHYARGLFGRRGEVNIGDDLGPLLFPEGKLLNRTMTFLGMGRDRSNGVMDVGPDGRFRLRWDSQASRLHLDRMRRAMERVSAELGGRFIENPLSALTRYVSVHPIGGCPMGDSEWNGVVSARTGEVFGHKGLYVVDGSVIPTAVGPNPSLTIGAVAELFAERFP